MASSSSQLPTSESIPADVPRTERYCYHYPHCYEKNEREDYHWDDERESWFACALPICPNRYSENNDDELPEWGIPIESWQESELLVEEYFRRGSVPEPAEQSRILSVLPSLVGTPVGTPVQSRPLSPQLDVTTVQASDISALLDEQEVEDNLFAPSLAEDTPLPAAFFEEDTSPQPFVESPVYFEPLVSVEEDQFFDLYIATAAMSEPKSESVPVLSRASEYKVWRAKMMGYLIFIEADDALYAGDLKDPTYKKANARASGTILMRTDISLHHLLVTTVDGLEKKKTAAEMWASLESHFGKPDAAFVWSQFQSLIKSNEMNDSKPMQDQINKILTTIKDVVNGGIKLEENTQALLLMSKVPESYLTMVSAIMATTALSDLKIDTLVNKILAEESLRRSGMGQSASKTSQVKTKGNGPCGHCGGAHGSEQCWTKYPHLRPQNKGGKGDKKGKNKGKGKGGNGNGNGSKKTNTVHKTQDGRTITVSSTTSDVSSSGSSNGNGAAQETVQEIICSEPNCTYCGRFSNSAGSLIASPLVIHHGGGTNSSSSTASGLTNISSGYYASRVTHNHSVGGRRISWLMDSGASQSVTNNLDDFWEYKPYTTPVTFGTAGSSFIQAIGAGTVKGLVKVNGGQRIWITLTNVAYIPNASGRLFSTGVVETSGHTLVQGSGSMVIYDRTFSHGKVSGEKVMEASYNPLNNLYYMHMDILERNEVHALTNPYRLWHRRMGHPSKEVIRRLPGNTKGADPVGVEDHSPCEGCQWGKAHRAPFPASYKRASKPLELVHTDEDGPMRTTSIQGYRYFISFLDDHTSLGRAYYLKHKSDSIQAFEDFKAWAENVTGNRIIAIHSD